MPAKNPRLTITLSPATKEQLERLSVLTGNSQGALVADLLEGSQPVFSRLITVLEAAKTASEGFKSEFSKGLEEAQGKLEGQLGLVLGVMDEATQPILKEAERVKRRARRAVGEGRADARAPAGLTPLSNRGVRFASKTAKNKKESRA